MSLQRERRRAGRPPPRALAELLCVLLLGATAGCELVKEGSRCKANAPLARSSTRVLRCVKGRWRKLMTIDQAAQIILSAPGSFEMPSVRLFNVTAGSTDLFAFSVKFLRRDGKAAPGVTVTSSASASGASATFPGGATAVTNDAGV